MRIILTPTEQNLFDTLSSGLLIEMDAYLSAQDSFVDFYFKFHTPEGIVYACYNPRIENFSDSIFSAGDKSFGVLARYGFYPEVFIEQIYLIDPEFFTSYKNLISDTWWHLSRTERKEFCKDHIVENKQFVRCETIQEID